MANEIHWDTATGLTLDFYRFQFDGDVFLSNGASDEVWGTSGDADFYDVAMTESGSSGHYVGDFDNVPAIAAGRYKFTIRRRGGANPADTDMSIARGEILWDGSAKIHRADEEDITTAHATSDALIKAKNAALLTIYDETNNA